MAERDIEAATRYLLLAAAVLVTSLAGYLGYVLYPRFDLPAVAGAGLLALAAAAAFAAFFSPCSFPLLMALLARQTTVRQVPRRRLPRALMFAASLSAGAATFVLSVGVLFALGGRGLASAITFASPAGRTLRIVVGTLLIVLGLVQTGRLRVSLRRFEPAVHGLLRRQAALRRRRPVAGTALFGFGYLAAGFG